MSKTVLVTGGTGFVGQALCPALLQKGHKVRVLSRGEEGHRNGIDYFRWDVDRRELNTAALEGIDAIIHLAGKNLADGFRWSSSIKKSIINSRVDSLSLLLHHCKEEKITPQLISASGTAAYFDGPKGNYTESSAINTHFFLGQVCALWENAAKSFEELGSKVSMVRTGVVFTSQSETIKPFRSLSMFPFIALPYKGNIDMSWIHRDDLVRIYLYLLENNKEGIYNGTSPQPLTLHELILKLRKGLRQPTIGVPPQLVRWVLGDKADILLTGGKVYPERLQKEGFTFGAPDFKVFIG